MNLRQRTLTPLMWGFLTSWFSHDPHIYDPDRLGVVPHRRAA